MLITYRRHTQSCQHKTKGRKHLKCACPIWIDWRVCSRRVRRPLGTRDWQNAQRFARDIEAAGIPQSTAPVTIEEGFRKFLADAKARNLQPSTIRKYELLSRKLDNFCKDRGLIFLRQLTVDQLRDFRVTWRMNSLTASKMIDRLKTFFKFCIEAEWADKNPATVLKPGQIDDPEVLPFTEEETAKILEACVSLNGNGQRIRLLTELMLNTGLRIGDACTISRERFVHDAKGWKVHLQTTKTKTRVFIPVPDKLVRDVQKLPGFYPFWTGESSPESCSGYWRKVYAKVFEAVGVEGHPHRFRHTFAKNMLVNEVPLETLSILLGHRKVAITEKHYTQFVPERQSLVESQVRKTWAKSSNQRAHTGHTAK